MYRFISKNLKFCWVSTWETARNRNRSET